MTCSFFKLKNPGYSRTLSWLLESYGNPTYIALVWETSQIYVLTLKAYVLESKFIHCMILEQLSMTMHIIAHHMQFNSQYIIRQKEIHTCIHMYKVPNPHINIFNAVRQWLSTCKILQIVNRIFINAIYFELWRRWILFVYFTAMRIVHGTNQTMHW